MLVLLPWTTTDPAALLAGQTLLAARGVADRPVDLALPTWKTSSTVDLAPVLQGLGLVTAFTADADLSGIAPGLAISQTVHRATTTVDETGTETAAVTAFGLASGALGNPPVPVRLAVVLDTKTGTPLFTGVINDPAMTSQARPAAVGSPAVLALPTLSSAPRAVSPSIGCWGSGASRAQGPVRSGTGERLRRRQQGGMPVEVALSPARAWSRRRLLMGRPAGAQQPVARDPGCGSGQRGN